MRKVNTTSIWTLYNHIVYPSLHNVTPSPIPQNPRDQMCKNKMFFLVVTFPSHTLWVSTIK